MPFNLALMTLIKEHLISKTTDGEAMSLTPSRLKRMRMKNFALAQLQQRRAQNTLISKLYETLESDSGKYTIDQLYRHFGAEGLGYKFEDFLTIPAREHRSAEGGLL